MKNSDLDTDLLAVALDNAEQKLAECETMLTAAINQADAASARSPQAMEELQALRQRLDAKEEQLRALHRELRQRDERISQLERLCAENAADHRERVTAMGLVLEPLDKSGAVHRIGRITTSIGRAMDNDIALQSTSASRYHARIVVASDSTYLIDLQSTNGCSVNGERVARQIISDGDVIAIGDAKFRFATGVALSEAEDKSMEETHVLLDESVVFSPAPAPQRDAARAQLAQDKTKAK